MTTIKDRLNALKIEQAELSASHDLMVAANQKANQEFQQAANKNQMRFQQIAGAIQELTNLQKLFEDETPPPLPKT